MTDKIRAHKGRYYERTEDGWVERRRSLTPAEILFDRGVINQKQLEAAKLYNREYWSSTSRPRYILTNSDHITIDARTGKPDYDPIGDERADASLEQIEKHFGRRYSTLLEEWAGIAHDWTFEGVERNLLTQSRLVCDFIVALHGLVRYYRL